MLLINNVTLEKISKPFRYIQNGILFLYTMLYIGLVSFKPSYIYALTLWFNTFICIFLLYKFNPFREHTLNKNDSKIIFASALFMMTNLGITEGVTKLLI
jgi:hypothetical protein